MTNAEAIETLRANYPDACFEQLREAVDKAIKALEAQDWIPCSKRLPEKEGLYFVTVHPDYIVPDSMHTDSLYWLDGKWWFFDYDARAAVWPDPIIAWKPLPEPYQEERKKEKEGE